MDERVSQPWDVLEVRGNRGGFGILFTVRRGSDFHPAMVRGATMERESALTTLAADAGVRARLIGGKTHLARAPGVAWRDAVRQPSLDGYQSREQERLPGTSRHGYRWERTATPAVQARHTRSASATTGN
jgi:hypothetical protein